MVKLLTYIFVVFFLAGCASKFEAIDSSYDRISFKDGITIEEAKTIAQKELLSKKINGQYLIFEPEVFTETQTVPRAQDHWFISFGEKSPGRIEVVYLVAMKKKDGGIVYSKRYFIGKEWTLQAYFQGLISP